MSLDRVAGLTCSQVELFKAAERSPCVFMSWKVLRPKKWNQLIFDYFLSRIVPFLKKSVTKKLLLYDWIIICHFCFETPNAQKRAPAGLLHHDCMRPMMGIRIHHPCLRKFHQNHYQKVVENDRTSAPATQNPSFVSCFPTRRPAALPRLLPRRSLQPQLPLHLHQGEGGPGRRLIQISRRNFIRFVIV